MREQWARNIALLTGLLVVLLAMLFAMIQNPSEPPSSAVSESDGKLSSSAALAEPDSEKQVLIAAGRKVFEAQRCARCHSIAGEGNPRNPLDGVGKRRSAEAIRQWILASAEIKDQLPAPYFQAKQTYQNLSPEELDALITYLQSLQPISATQKN